MVIATTQTLKNIFSNRIDTNNFLRQVHVLADLIYVDVIRQQNVALTNVRTARAKQPLTVIEAHRHHMPDRNRRHSVKLTDRRQHHLQRISHQSGVIAVDKHMAAADVVLVRANEPVAEVCVHLRLRETVVNTKQLEHNIVPGQQGRLELRSRRLLLQVVAHNSRVVFKLTHVLDGRLEELVDFFL